MSLAHDVFQNLGTLSGLGAGFLLAWKELGKWAIAREKHLEVVEVAREDTAQHRLRAETDTLGLVKGLVEDLTNQVGEVREDVGRLRQALEECETHRGELIERVDALERRTDPPTRLAW